MTKQDIEARLKEIFKPIQGASEELNDLISRGWVYSEPQHYRDVLFVGINPSYVGKDKENKDYCYTSEGAVTGYPKYYKQFQTIAQELFQKNPEATWGYMDLFYFRETHQKIIDNILTEKSGAGVKFICQQLQLTFEILNEVAPKVIVVCNKRTWDFWGLNRKREENVWMGFNFEGTLPEIKTITGFSSDFICYNELKLKPQTKIVFGKHLSWRTSREYRASLTKSIKYALEHTK